MIEKIEKVLDLALEALSLYIDEARARRGEALPLRESVPAAQEQPAAKPPRAPRKKKEAPEAVLPPVPAPAPAPSADTFGLGAAPAAAMGPSEEVMATTQKKFQELGSAFIRRHKDAKPSGLERFKTICTEVCQRPIGQLADMRYADHVKLIERFEKELAAA